ncbi:hypothetical protein G3M48_009405, partial [Beauveria asiatica]
MSIQSIRRAKTSSTLSIIHPEFVVADHGAAVEDADEGKGEPRERRKGWTEMHTPVPVELRARGQPPRVPPTTCWAVSGTRAAAAAAAHWPLISRTTKMLQKMVMTLGNRRKAYCARATISAPPWPLRRAHLRALLLGVQPPPPSLGISSTASILSSGGPRQA